MQFSPHAAKLSCGSETGAFCDSFHIKLGLREQIVCQRDAYRKMLVLTGVLLGLVLIVMVGEQAQEMQLAHWLPTTPVPWLTERIPAWMGLWFSVFPTVETLMGQALAFLLVLGSYFVAERSKAISR